MDFYDQNLAILRTHHPELVDLVESTEVDDNRFKVSSSEGGEPRVVYMRDDGSELPIHTGENPAGRANDALAFLGSMGPQGIAVLFGFGLGYFAEELVRVFGKGHLVMIYEASPELFKISLKMRDLSGVLSSDKVKIYLGEKVDDFTFVHAYHHHIMFGRFWLVRHDSSVKLKQEAYEMFHKRLLDEKRQSETGIGTAIGLGKKFIDTFMQNVPLMIRRQGVSKLKDLFKGRPAIVVSAGPSLEKNFHLLKKAKGRAIIIAVDVVLPTLLPAGIIPDILVAIDPMEENISVFKDNPLLKDVPFICLAQYTPEIVDLYPGPMFMNMVRGNIIFQWLAAGWEDKGCIDCFGGSVAHLGFATAEHLGCTVIALIGQDLSYAKKLHAGDATKLLADFHGTDVPDYTKGAPISEDIFGERCYTMGSFLSFKTSFEQKIKVFEGAVVNATEGGLPIEGALPMRLTDFISDYCDLPEIDCYSVLSALIEGDVGYNLDGLMAQVRGAKDIFTGIRNNAHLSLKHVHTLMRLRRKKKPVTAEMQNIIAKIEKLRQGIQHPILNIIASYHYQLELYLHRQEIQDMDEIEDNVVRLDNQLWRALNYYGELIEAVDLFVKQLDKLAQGLKRELQINRLLTDDSLSEFNKYRRVGMIYKKAGIATQSVRYLEKALALTRHTILPASEPASIAEIRLSLAEMYLQQFRFYEASEMLEQWNVTSKRLTDCKQEEQKAKAAQLSETCNRQIEAWEERKERMRQLLKRAEDSYGSHLESGIFYFRTKEYERAKGAYLRAIEECETGRTYEKVADGDAPLAAAYYGLAHTYICLQEHEHALDAFANAIEANPANPMPYRDLGLMAVENGDAGQAEFFLAKALDLAPHFAELYVLLGKLHMSLGDAEKALSIYESGLSQNPGDPRLQQELALVYRDVIVNGRAAN